MMEKFHRYWDVIHGIIGVAAILDPRFKMKLLDWMFGQIYGDRAAFEIHRIKSICYDLLNEYKKKESNVNPSCTSSSRTTATEFGGSDFLSGFELFVSNDHTIENVKVELDHYLEDGVLPRSEGFEDRKSVV